MIELNPQQLDELIQLDQLNINYGRTRRERMALLIAAVNSQPRGWRKWFQRRPQQVEPPLVHYSRYNVMALQQLLATVAGATKGSTQLDRTVCETLLPKLTSRTASCPTTTMSGAYLLKEHLAARGFVKAAELQKGSNSRWMVHLGFGGSRQGVTGYGATQPLAMTAAVIQHVIVGENLR